MSIQFDERETMFARLSLIEGSKAYKEYYASHTDQETIDKSIKGNMSKMMGKDLSKEKSEKLMKNMQRMMKIMAIVSKITGKGMSMESMNIGDNKSKPLDIAIDKLANPISRDSQTLNNEATKQKVEKEKVILDKVTASDLVKEVAKIYGADIVGIAKVDENTKYSHRAEMMGTKIDDSVIRDDYKYVIVVASALDKDLINTAPRFEAMIGSHAGYARSSTTSAQLTKYIKSLGFHALPDNFQRYYSPTTPVSLKAGIGQLGRSNMTVNPIYGNRLKMGAVWTNMELVEDGECDFGLNEFCEKCNLCSGLCPSKAICSGQPTKCDDGSTYYKHREDKCMEMWTKTGTDCGVCMSACPFSQGIDPELVKQIKTNPQVIDTILDKHKEKFGKRNYLEKYPNLKSERRELFEASMP